MGFVEVRNPITVTEPRLRIGSHMLTLSKAAVAMLGLTEDGFVDLFFDPERVAIGLRVTQTGGRKFFFSRGTGQLTRPGGVNALKKLVGQVLPCHMEDGMLIAEDKA